MQTAAFYHRAGTPVHWRTDTAPVAFPDALRTMTRSAQAIREGEQSEWVWALEHPPLYTAGTSADPRELFNPQGFPVYDAGRGGRYTYHGPGQRVVYLMLDLDARRRDVRAFIAAVEGWLKQALLDLGVEAHSREGRVGLWVERGNGREDKIAAIGVRLKRWVSLHGIALNVAPDLEAFQGIVPCGIREAQFGVTSLADLGVTVDMARVDKALQNAFCEVFGPVTLTGAADLGAPLVNEGAT